MKRLEIIDEYSYRQIMVTRGHLERMVIRSTDVVECEDCGDAVNNIWKHVWYHMWIDHLSNTASLVYA
jgi:hypothetical protein